MTRRFAPLLATLLACAPQPTPQPVPVPVPTLAASAPKPKVVVEGHVDHVFPMFVFATKAAMLAPGYDGTLDALARTILDDPEQLAGIALVGHASADEPRADSLSFERASAVATALRRRGVPDERLRTASYGSWCPLDPAASAEAREKNRRVEIRVVRDARGPVDHETGCDAARLLPTAARSSRAGNAKPLDTSDWAQAAPDAELALEWTVDQSKAQPPLRDGDPNDDRTRHDVPLDLTLRVDGHAHSLAFRTHGGVPGMGLCSGVRFFWAGLLSRFELQRLTDGRVFVTYTVGGEASADVTTALSVFAAPAKARVSQSLVVVAPDGTRTTETCLGSVRP